ncbi:MAG TPA: 30S ribosomal protein S5 [Patescibacteria group bacterium]|nr:30S ribosomal protein S5 [Patescibacteria group bacterium]
MVEERDKRRRQNRGPAEKDKIGEKVLLIRRVTKKTPGGNYISFSALVAVGDGQGKIGVGLGRGLEVPQAIRKAMSRARKHMITVPIYKTTLPHDIRVKYKGAYIILKPAPPGAGLKVGSVVRSLLSLAGVVNASGKIVRSRNQIANTYAVMKAISMLRKRE